MQLIMLCLIPCICSAQLYNNESGEKFKYKEIVDTIFINNTYLVPGDTVFLGKGSAPDNSFLFIHQAKKNSFFMTQKPLPKELSEKYIIYRGREKSKAVFSYYPYGYQVFFTSPFSDYKYISVTWYSALETHEVQLRPK